VAVIDCGQRQQPPRLLGIFRFSRQVAQFLSSEILAKSNRPAHGSLRISPIHSESQRRSGGNPTESAFPQVGITAAAHKLGLPGRLCRRWYHEGLDVIAAGLIRDEVRVF
jgi:hypothetical protein